MSPSLRSPIDEASLCYRCGIALGDDDLATGTRGPSGTVSSSAATSLARFDQLIEAYDGRIPALAAALERMCSKRASLIAARNALVPFCKFPAEILSEIFMFFIPARGHDMPPAEPPFLLTLAQVCRAWRNAALSSPCLWSHIQCTYGSSVYDTFCSRGLSASLVKEVYLPRSGRAPLTVQVKVWDTTDEDDQKLFDDLCCASSRFRHLDIETDPMEMGCVARATVDLSSLRTLKLRVTSNMGLIDYQWGLPRTWEINSRASLLNEVHLTVPMSCIKLPWQQLLTATLAENDLSDMFELLMHCGHLQTLTASSKQWRVLSMPPGGFVSHSALRALVLDMTYGQAGAFGHVFRLLSLPELVNLTVDLGESDPWNQESFLLFLRRSECVLTTLSLSGPAAGTTYDEHNLISLFAYLPYLESLSLISVVQDNGTQLFGSMHYCGDEDHSVYLLPKLHHLKLAPTYQDGEWWSVKPWDGAMLSSMIRSRSPTHPGSQTPQGCTTDKARPHPSCLRQVEILCGLGELRVTRKQTAAGVDITFDDHGAESFGAMQDRDLFGDGHGERQD